MNYEFFVPLQLKKKKIMKDCYQFVKKYPLTLLCIAIVWVLSLVPFFPETPFDNVEFADKWTHLVMYGGTCCVLWIEYLRSHRIYNKVKLFVWAWLAPILMGGLLELLQAYATTTRNGDWLDFAANSLGVTLGAVFGMILLYVRSRKSKA
jgi:VanZ family protein